jgi:hypothetical protein
LLSTLKGLNVSSPPFVVFADTLRSITIFRYCACEVAQ